MKVLRGRDEGLKGDAVTFKGWAMHKVSTGLVTVLLCFGLVISGVGPAGASAENDTAVLGKRDFMGEYGKGWGTVKPRVIYNGGTAGGYVKKIGWRDWGTYKAHARGRTYAYKPGGGMYRRSVGIKLRAFDKGTCPGSSKTAYRRLKVSVQKRPGGRFGRWHSWSGSPTICTYNP